MDIAEFSSSRNLHTFTPLRRREYPIYTRQDDHGIEWTTARCHRLLRALTSRVAILTKELARYSTVNRPSSDRNKRVVDAKSPDGDWGKAKKKLRQTYSSKGKKAGNGQNAEKSRILPPNQGRRSLIPGEVLIPTPVLARARREYSEDEPRRLLEPEPEQQNFGKNKRRLIRRGVDENTSSFQLSESLRDLRHKTSAARFTIYEGIHNGLEALLVATAPAKPEIKRKGARPLFAMTLRAIPKYIAQQDSLVKQYMEEAGSRSAFTNRDMSTEIYDELEGFGLSGNGWKHLKTIVRSHGVQVVANAIEAGLLEIGFVGCLVTLCVQINALDEAQSLFAALLSSTQFAPPRSLYEKPSRTLSMLWKFTEHTGKLPFQYRELSGLFTSGLLPLEWVATKNFGPLWTGLFQTLSPGSENIEALVFLGTLIPLLSSALSNTDGLETSNSIIVEAVTNTFSSLLTTLSSIIILNRERETLDGLGLGTPSRDIFNLLNNSSIRMQQEPWTVALLPLLAALFTRPDVDENDDYFIGFLAKKLQYERSNDQKSYAKIVQFTCSTARCCGRGALNSGFDYLQHLHGLLEACDKATRTNIFKSLIVDSAFLFAEQTPDRVHLQYAAEMDSKFNVRRFDPDSGSCSISDEGEQMSGFRWEEGIGEWVSASPFAVKKIAVSISNPEESECDTPYRPPPNLRRKLEKEPPPLYKPAALPALQVVIKVANMTNSSLTCEGNFDVDYEGLCGQHLSESDDELGPESSQTGSSIVSDTSFDGTDVTFAEESFASANSSLSLTSTNSVFSHHSVERVLRLNRKALYNSQDWATFGNSSSMSIASSAESKEGIEARKFVGKAPRVGRKALRSSQTFQMLNDNESDDELSFVSVTCLSQNQAEELLPNVTDTSVNTRRLQQWAEKAPATSGPKMLRSMSGPAKRKIFSVAASDSEDELCM